MDSVLCKPAIAAGQINHCYWLMLGLLNGQKSFLPFVCFTSSAPIIGASVLFSKEDVCVYFRAAYCTLSLTVATTLPTLHVHSCKGTKSN